MVPLEEQVVPINLGTGLDTKTDSKQVQGKVLLLENALFTAPKRISKRPGYDLISNATISGGTLTSPKMNKTLNQELICADSGNLYSYSTTLSQWVPKGPYNSTKVTDTFPFKNDSGGAFFDFNPSVALLGNYLLLSKTSGGTLNNAGVDANVRTTIIDINTSDVLLDRGTVSPISGTYQVVKSVVLGNAKLASFMEDSSGKLRAEIFNLSTLTTVPISAVTYNFLAGNTNVVSLAGAAYAFPIPQFDVCPTSTGACIVYSTSASGSGSPTDLTVITVNTAGAVTHTATITGEGQASPVSIVQGTDGKIWVYWVDNSNLITESMKLVVYNSDLSIFQAKTTLFSGKKYIGQITAYPLSASSQEVYWTDRPTVGDTTAIEIRKSVITSSASVSSDVFSIWGVEIYSKVISYNGNRYLPTVYPFDPQVTLFLLNMTDSANGVYAAAKALGGAASGFQPPSTINQSMSLSADKFAFGAGKILGEFSQASVASVIPITSAGYVSFDFASTDSYQGRVFGNNLILNGGIVTQYDGRICAELGFNVFPKIDSATATTGGSLSSGLYLYSAIYSWTDNNGDLHQSAVATTSITIDTGTGNRSVTLKLKMLHLTQKNVSLQVYRTAANGTVSYLILSSNNVPSSDSTTYVDTIADSGITSSQILYTNGGIIENIAPPPAMFFTENNDRLLLLDSENPDTIWYCKTKSLGIGISFSDLLTLQEDSIGGDVTSIAAMDGKLVSFKADKILYHAGDGANDLGLGSTFSLAQLIPTDTGCNASKSVIVFPNGIIFKGNKGVYLLDRSLSVGYLGADVESYNSQDITSAVMMPTKNHIRFLTSSGSSLVYDYFVNTWSIFTNHTGLSADIWQNLYVYTRTDGSIYSENSTSYLDNATAYKVKAQLAWIKMASIQGYQRVRRIGLLGNFQGAAGHGVRISAAYDFGTNFSTPVSYSFSGSNASFQYRERLPIQKCDALGLLIEEVTTGASGEYIDLTDLSLEVGVKKGINKLQASQTVG